MSIDTGLSNGRFLRGPGQLAWRGLAFFFAGGAAPQVEFPTLSVFANFPAPVRSVATAVATPERMFDARRGSRNDVQQQPGN
jgi:hypothetical protein